jgi:nitrate reductase beta subunit
MSVTSWLVSKVKNWQIKREMGYPYAESRPDKQIAYVFDINKCIACQTCSVACKTTWTSGKGQEVMFWNNVETKPYGGYPLRWDLNILKRLNGQSWDKDGTYTGKTVFEAAPQGERVLGWLPREEDYSYPNIGEDECSEIVERGISSPVSIRYGCSILQGFATTVHTLRALQLVRERPYTREKKTG